jgi:hypothetical protein
LLVAFIVVVGTAINMILRTRGETPKPRLDGPPMPAPRTTGA